jgi:hypothetical protein
MRFLVGENSPPPHRARRKEIDRTICEEQTESSQTSWMQWVRSPSALKCRSQKATARTPPLQLSDRRRRRGRRCYSYQTTGDGEDAAATATTRAFASTPSGRVWPRRCRAWPRPNPHSTRRPPSYCSGGVLAVAYRHSYQPLVCSNSFGSSLATSMPRMASPKSSQHSATTAGSL